MHIELIPARDLPNAWNALITMPDGMTWLDTRSYTSRTSALRAYIPNKSATHITTVMPQAAAPKPKHAQTDAMPKREFFPPVPKPHKDVTTSELVESHGAPCAWRTEIARLNEKLKDPTLSYKEQSRTRLLIVSAEAQMQLHHETVRETRKTDKAIRDEWLANADRVKQRAAKNAKRRAAYAAKRNAA